MANSFVNNFEVPSWAGKPPPGLHLDVMKETKMVQKLMIDEKKCYFFGRNKQLCDFCIDHASCSRVHTALVWHKHLNRPFIVDLGSTHGTFIGTIMLDSKKPQQVPIDSEIHFGASTRRYVIRERPQMPTSMQSDDTKGDEIEGGLLGLPETESELEHLTEFNTARNRRITGVSDVPDVPANPLKRKWKNTHVKFRDEEEVINPEDIDPSVGKFRNLIQTTVIPTKKLRMEGALHMPTMTDSITKRLQSFPYTTPLYMDMTGETGIDGEHGMGGLGMGITSQLGLRLPNLAPEVDIEPPVQVAPVNPAPSVAIAAQDTTQPSALEPKKKKYAKEAWPGKKPAHSLLPV